MEECELVVGAHEVVLRIFDLVVCVAVDVVGEETHCLHVGEEGCGIGEVFDLHREEEALGALKITFGESAEDVHIKLYLVDCGIIFSHLVGAGAEEVAVVGEDIRGHHGVEVDYAEHIALFVKHHVVDLCVAVADALGELAFAVEALGGGHLVGVAEDIVELGLDFGYTPLWIGLYSLTKLLETELHVVEVRNALGELGVDIDEARLKLAKRTTAVA